MYNLHLKYEVEERNPYCIVAETLYEDEYKLASILDVIYQVLNHSQENH